jgi:hypothetical protein
MRIWRINLDGDDEVGSPGGAIESGTQPAARLRREETDG